MAANNKKQWIVLDSVTKIQSQPLSDEQLQMSVMRMQERDWDRFFIWTESWEKWQPLRQFLQSNEKNFLNVVQLTGQKNKTNEDSMTKSVTYVRTDSESINSSYRPHQGQNIDIDQIQVDQNKPPENLNFKKLHENNNPHKTRSTRHELKIEILLISKMGKTFRSYSKNISLTGTLLEDNVPFDYYGEVFDIVVVNRYAKDPASSRVQTRGTTVGDGVSRRLQFEPMSEHTKSRLVFLLNEYLENQRNVVKKSS